MKYTHIIAALASLATTAQAHTRVWGIWLNGVDQGNGVDNYIRSPPTNDPVKDLNSQAMSCNVNNRPVSRTIDVKSGDTVTFEWFHDFRGDEIIATSHKGPVQVYIAPTSSNGAGNVWVKLFSEAYTGGSWAVDKLIAAKGQHSVKIPNLTAGTYLLRPEIPTLHEANVAWNTNNARGNQFYMNCVQIRVTSSGSVSLPSGIAFPGGYTYSTPGVVWNLYGTDNPANYQAPGPSVWSGSAGGNIGRAPPPGATTTTSGSSPTGGTGAPLYGQCGGIGWSGPTTCASGTCKVSNEYYSQCLP
ncbi:carbohydrate-binding module family 1 protein [Botryobasidium botryosum FD-172 SS1]|uniref:AA9 family lytic polysaccharide monooxygenase n=1 Tax=Botryobasidium botryosum (strain FD-172 SS1) TaxID=930990 RepID=A0A067MYB6_BOTB1|nr:carbohydrate-binding module family 1 protein [Botryobasidium botryosum FD-172 SS1]